MRASRLRTQRYVPTSEPKNGRSPAKLEDHLTLGSVLSAVAKIPVPDLHRSQEAAIFRKVVPRETVAEDVQRIYIHPESPFWSLCMLCDRFRRRTSMFSIDSNCLFWKLISESCTSEYQFFCKHRIDYRESSVK